MSTVKPKQCTWAHCFAWLIFFVIHHFRHFTHEIIYLSQLKLIWTFSKKPMNRRFNHSLHFKSHSLDVTWYVKWTARATEANTVTIGRRIVRFLTKKCRSQHLSRFLIPLHFNQQMGMMLKSRNVEHFIHIKIKYHSLALLFSIFERFPLSDFEIF